MLLICNKEQFTFDQLSPTWGWKHMIGHQISLFNDTLLSINSPQPGDGNYRFLHLQIRYRFQYPFDQLSPTWGWKLSNNLPSKSFHLWFFRSTLPNLGMETRSCRYAVIKFFFPYPFDQLSPTWGWKPCSSELVLFNSTTFDQLSPTWGWKLE